MFSVSLTLIFLFMYSIQVTLELKVGKSLFSLRIKLL